jgi:protein-disulfide isomerase
MLRRFFSIVLSLLLSVIAFPAVAQTKTCDALKGAERVTASSVLKSAHPHDCCDGTILECLARKPVCPLAMRLANDVCRRAGAGQSQKDIERELVRRATSTMSPKVSIDVSSAVIAGESNAPVEIVAYLCARCPYCAKLTPQLYESVTKGRLKGKAKIVVRPFPVRSHKHSTIMAKAMLGAASLGQFWPYLLHLYANFERFDPEKIPECAAKAGLDPERFRALLADPGLEQILVAAKKEGVRNQVDATPTLFINRRKYEAEPSLAAIEDFVEERLEAQ